MGILFFYILVVNAKVRTSNGFPKWSGGDPLHGLVWRLILYGQFEISGGDDVGRGSYTGASILIIYF